MFLTQLCLRMLKLIPGMVHPRLRIANRPMEARRLPWAVTFLPMPMPKTVRGIPS